MSQSHGFPQQLADSRLLSADELTSANTSLSQGVAPADVVRSLVERQVLTPWQAKRLLAGQTAFFLGKYKLLSHLGKGGMGSVYKARQGVLGRIVALKVMAPELVQSAESVARFHREIQAAAALQHPNVVTAFDADQVGQTHFLVMEYLEGESLDAVIKREGRLPVELACEYARQAALGLQHAHEQGMAHRDIKPSNLWIARSAEGQPVVKVLDMGLARFTSESQQEGELTQTGQVMGTPDYIAPEQAQRTKEADIRSDIFSLGCTLFRMLTGQLPYQGSNVMEKLMARAMAEAPRLCQFAPQLPTELEEVVARMLARDRAQRYQTPAEVARALEPFSLTVRSPEGAVALASQSVASRSPGAAPRQSAALVAGGEADPLLLNLSPHDRSAPAAVTAGNFDFRANTDAPLQTAPPRAANEQATPSSLSRRMQRRSRNRGHGTLLFGLSALILMALLGTYVWNRLSATHLEIDWPEEERAKAKLEVDGRQLPVPPQGNIAVPEGRAGKRTVRLVRPGYEELVFELDFARGESRTIRPEWQPTATAVRKGHLAEIRREVERLTDQAHDPGDSAADEERRQLSARYREVRGDLLGTSELPTLENLWRKLPSPLDRLEGQSVPAVDRKIAEVHAATSTVTGGLVAIWGDGRLKPAALREIDQLVIDPLGRVAVTIASQFSGTVWELDQGTPWMTIPGLSATAFSRDGQLMALMTPEVEIWSLETRERKLALMLPPDFRLGRCLAFVPESPLLAISEGNDAIVLWDWERDELHSRYVLPGEIHLVAATAVSPDGRWLAASGVEGTLQLWNLSDKSSRTLSQSAMNTQVMSFRPDSRILAVGVSNLVQLWDVPKGELVRTITRENFGVHSLSWNADGTSLACNSIQGGFQLFDPQTGACTRTVAARGGGNALAQYTNSDRLVVCDTRGDINVVESPALVPQWQLPAQVTCAGMDPCGDWLVVGTTAPALELWRLGDGSTIRQWKLPKVPQAIDVRSDGQRIVVNFRGSEQPEVFDPAAETSWTVPVRDMTLQCAYTPDSRHLVLAGPGGLTVWEDRGTLPVRQVTTTAGESYQGFGFGVSADSNWAVLVGALPGWKPVLEVFDLKTGDAQRKTPIEHATHVVASPASRNYLVALNNYGLRVADGVSLEVIGTGVSEAPPPNWWTSFCPLPDRPGDFVASTADSRLFFLTMEARKVMVTRVLHLGGLSNSARRVLATPDGRHLILVMVNGTVWVLRDSSTHSDL